jgi:hypothetical protein
VTEPNFVFWPKVNPRGPSQDSGCVFGQKGALPQSQTVCIVPRGDHMRRHLLMRTDKGAPDGLHHLAEVADQLKVLEVWGSLYSFGRPWTPSDLCSGHQYRWNSTGESLVDYAERLLSLRDEALAAVEVEIAKACRPKTFGQAE